MFGFYAAEKAYKAQEISNIDFIRSSNNLSEGTNKAKIRAALYQLQIKDNHKPAVEQTIIRDL